MEMETESQRSRMHEKRRSCFMVYPGYWHTLHYTVAMSRVTGHCYPPGQNSSLSPLSSVSVSVITELQSVCKCDAHVCLMVI